MTKKIIAFGASSSRQSINKRLASFAAKQIEGAEVNVLDLNDFEMPIFSVDRQQESGIPVLATKFKQHIKNADAIVISFAEHNGAYSTAFKNLFDWISRIEKDVWMNKPMFLLATSPGGRGGKSALDIAFNKFKFMNTNTIAYFSLPSFNQNFSEDDGITNRELNESFNQQLTIFSEALQT